MLPIWYILTIVVCTKCIILEKLRKSIVILY